MERCGQDIPFANHDGVAVDRKLIRSEVVRKQVTRVVAVGVAKPRPRR